MKPTSANASTKSGKPSGLYSLSPRVPPWQNCRFSVIVPRVAGEKWIIRGSIYNYDELTVEQVMQTVEKVVEDLRAEGRKRVTIWTRSQADADLHKVKRVIWAGDSEGPGFGAYKAGTYGINNLAAAIQFHVGMST
jgi:hypothetical protein